jgi:hypothetical protein
MKTIKTRCFLDRLKGHKDGVISIFSPDGPEGTSIYSY